MSSARTLTIPIEGTRETLEARLVRASGPAPLAIIAPPHPLYGGSIGNPVVRALERAFHEAGHATLAFNFRGVGESTGEPSAEPRDALTDYLAIVRSVPDQAPAWLAGYSFGSIAALAAAVELRSQRVVMVAPPLGLLDAELFASFQGTLAVAAGSDDEYAPAAALRALCESRPRTTLEVIDDADHFFLGSAAQRAFSAFQRLLGSEARS